MSLMNFLYVPDEVILLKHGSHNTQEPAAAGLAELACGAILTKYGYLPKGRFIPPSAEKGEGEGEGEEVGDAGGGGGRRW